MNAIKNSVTRRGRTATEQFHPYMDKGLFFDSELTVADGGKTLTLTLILRVAFVPVITGQLGDSSQARRPDGIYAMDKDGQYFLLSPWRDGFPSEADTWVKKTVDVVNQVWNGNLDNNGKFYLTAPKNFDALDVGMAGLAPGQQGSGQFLRPFIACAFRCEKWAHNSEKIQPHLKTRTVHLAREADCSTFRGQMDYFAQKFNEKHPIFGQITVAHEIGHALGLEHIQDYVPDCGKTNGQVSEDPYCFSGPAGENIMGFGNNVEPVNSLPWRKALLDHLPGSGTKAEDWTATSQPPKPMIYTVS